MTRGRKRYSKNLPAHIKDASKLPARVWYNKSGSGKWMLDYHDTAADKWRAKRLCAGAATMPEIWAAYEAQQTQTVTTFKTLAEEFQKTLAWRELEISTQRDYLGCHKQIINTKLTTGLFGDVPVDRLSVGKIRQYRDFRAEESKSRANKEMSYMARVFAWAYEYEKIKTNPAKGIKKLYVPPRQHYAEDKDYYFLLEVARESGYWYMPYAMEIAYLCRMRLCEVVDLCDADERPEGLYIHRRKGSRDNITAWSHRLQKAWSEAKEKRNEIIKAKRLPLAIKPELRPLFISERTGDKLAVSSLKTAKDRIDKAAIKKAQALGVEFKHFTFHDIKTKSITDTTGDKMAASGHRSPSMMNIYDLSVKTVKATGDE